MGLSVIGVSIMRFDIGGVISTVGVDICGFDSVGGIGIGSDTKD